ncbi:hypothetical protein LCGC14_3028400 [marine sediment metagenome]|uniref:General secretion pathway GspH domain-containing protein n=1 Tax=marine sediment metagenome TaxID=412755 RepID=A0A0F8Z0W1_9ZZZZ
MEPRRLPAGDIAGPASGARQPDAGITLVEILVVIAIIGVLAGALSLSLGSVARGPDAAQEATRLTARLNRASELSRLTGTASALIWDRQGYRFAVHDGSGWVLHPEPLLAQREDLPNAITLDAMSPEGVPVETGIYLLRPDSVLPADAAPLDLRVASRNRAGWSVSHDGVNGLARPADGDRP